MTYNHRAVVRAVRTRLYQRPFESSSRIADDLGVARDTLRRALSSGGVTFSDLRHEAIVARLKSLSEADRPMSAKEMSNLLGCSSRSLLRWRLRLKMTGCEVGRSTTADGDPSQPSLLLGEPGTAKLPVDTGANKPC